jgi:hypothetical protein
MMSTLERQSFKVELGDLVSRNSISHFNATLYPITIAGKSRLVSVEFLCSLAQESTITCDVDLLRYTWLLQDRPVLVLEFAVGPTRQAASSLEFSHAEPANSAVKVSTQRAPGRLYMIFPYFELAHLRFSITFGLSE